jgi:hypothetical protein
VREAGACRGTHLGQDGLLVRSSLGGTWLRVGGRGELAACRDASRLTGNVFGHALSVVRLASQPLSRSLGLLCLGTDHRVEEADQESGSDRVERCRCDRPHPDGRRAGLSEFWEKLHAGRGSYALPQSEVTRLPCGPTAQASMGWVALKMPATSAAAPMRTMVNRICAVLGPEK